ncbi:TPA: lamin tail domain-containing protein [Candidatus Woesearchaeota archaeon]|nr:lamin tail domain-containing protein [Candidatus Woesearchaeota archaeon]
MRWFSFVMFLLILPLVSSFEITEIMYAPDSDIGGSSNEWVEVFSGDSTVNLSSCIFNGNEIDTNLTIDANSYFVIVRDKGAFEEVYGVPIPIIETSFGRGLSNNGGEIEFSCADEEDTVTYQDTYAKKNSKTLEKNKKGQWKESLREKGTPGTQNSNYQLSYDYTPIEITEVMPDPFGSDDRVKPEGEWVELYNSGKDTILLNELVLYDSDEDHELYITNTNTNSNELCGGCYVIIYRNGDGDFDLSKNNDAVRLYSGYPIADNVLIDEMTYSNAIEGNSFSKFEDGWSMTIPTPGKENVFTSSCDWEVSIDTVNSIFKKDDFEFVVTVQRKHGEPQEITVKGEIEDLFGRTIKEYTPWTKKEITTKNTKKYSPNLKEDVYQLHFWIEGLVCEDMSVDDNEYKTLFAINPQYKESASSLSIEQLYLGKDEEARWGEQVRVKLDVYKGDETKHAVQMWVEKEGERVSATTKVNVHDPFKHYPLTLPLQMDANCNNKIDDGKVTLVVEAFGLHEENEFRMEGVSKKICKDYLDYVKEDRKERKKKQRFRYDVTRLPTTVESGGYLPLSVQVVNDDAFHLYDLWAYVYRGSKCYSCAEGAREDSMQQFSLSEKEAKVLDFILPLDEEMEGEYSIKIKLRKDGQKTTKDLTKKIVVVAPKVNVVEESVRVVGVSEENNQEEDVVFRRSPLSSSTGAVIYESSSTKAFNMIPYVLILSLILLGVVVWRKK